MQQLIILALIGFLAQLVDGSLGMAYGLTSATLLMSAGVAPRIASASVHLAELGTTLVAGISHARLGNVNWRVVVWIAVPGAVGGFLGAGVLSNMDASQAKPLVAIFLTILGAYVLVRFAFLPSRNIALAADDTNVNAPAPAPKLLPPILLAPLGLFAGFMDAVGGGGWGPISTPTLLSSGRLEPRHTIGTVDTAEFLVALGASVGFLMHLPANVINFNLVGALLIGGVVAAPLAALLVRYLPPRILGVAVGGMILLYNGRTILSTYEPLKNATLPITVLFAILWAVTLGIAILQARSKPNPTLTAA